MLQYSHLQSTASVFLLARTNIKTTNILTRPHTMESHNSTRSKSTDTQFMLSTPTNSSTSQLLKAKLMPKHKSSARPQGQPSTSEKQARRGAASFSSEILANYAALR